MTREEAKQFLPMITAFASGETIQCQKDGVWVDVRWPLWNRDVDYRIKPTPQLRPWKPENVKPCLLRYCTSKDWQTLIGVTANGCVMVLGHPGHLVVCEVAFDVLQRHWLYSADGGATFKPCGVEE